MILSINLQENCFKAAQHSKYNSSSPNHLSFQKDFCSLLLTLFSNHRSTLNSTPSLTSQFTHILHILPSPLHTFILHAIFSTQHLEPQPLLINQQPSSPLLYKRSIKFSNPSSPNPPTSLSRQTLPSYPPTRKI
jgi:hypothetical protein